MIRSVAAHVSNWGRWGADDQVGTLNLVTPEKIVAAAGLVRIGRVFSLAIPFDSRGPQIGVPGRFNPIHTMLAAGTDVLGEGDFGHADDMIAMPLQCATQWDSLAHVFHDGRMYNGQSASLVGSRGAARNGIEHLQSRVVTRGVLLDVARARGVDALAPRAAIGPEDLKATARAQGIAIGVGDAVLVRTGFMRQFLERGDWSGYAMGDAPGVSLYSLEWLHESQVAALATDTYRLEPTPSELPGIRVPLHQIAIPYMGLLLGEIFRLEELAEDCANDGIYEFLFVAPPLPVTGAVGSPVNPYAMK